MNAHRSLPSQPIGNKEKNHQPIARVRNILNVELSAYELQNLVET
jgi:hypothetical protein